MTRDRRRDLASILEGDLDFLEEAIDQGLIARGPSEELSELELERVRVARVLIRELEINWAGAEVIVRLREELLATRSQIRQLLDEMRRNRRG